MLKSLFSKIKAKNILLLVFLIVLSYCSSFAQQGQNVDSLLKVLETSKEDTNKVNTLNALTNILWRIPKIVDAKKYSDLTIALAQKLNFKKGLAAAYNTAGIIAVNQGNYTQGLKNYLTALRIFEEIKNKKGAAGCYINIGIIYSWQDNNSEALKMYLASQKIYEELKDSSSNYLNLCNNVAHLYRDIGNYPEALKPLFASLKVSEKKNDARNIAITNLNIGATYEQWGNLSEALKYYQLSLKIAKQANYQGGIAASYVSLGSLNETMENYSEADKYYLSALDIYVERKNKPRIASCNRSIGHLYNKLKKYDESRKFLTAAAGIDKELGSIDNLRDDFWELTLLDSTTKNWEEAYKDYKFFIFNRDSLESNISSKKMIQAQAQFEFEKKEDSLKYQQALTNEELKQQILLSKHQQQSLLLKEKELDIANKDKELQQLQIDKDSTDLAIQKIEADKKQEQLSVLNKEKAIQSLEAKKQKQAKNYFIAGLALFVVLSFFIYWNYLTRQKLKLQTLRNKIASDLHDDIGSTLSSISIFSQMAQENSVEVKPLLQTIGESSRKMLDAMADIVWTINPDNDQFEKIIMRMRSFAYELLGAKQIEFRFVADSNIANVKLSMENRRNLYLIFKEATNNMVKYSEASRAMFTIKEEQGKLIMLIKDNGKGFNSSKETHGNGLKNMKKRANEMGAVLMIDSTPGNGTNIKLELAV